MSEKATKHKRKEKETQRELEEEKRHADAIKAALINSEGQIDFSGDVVLVVGAEGSDVIKGDEPIPVSQRKDSTDDDLMNVMQMRVQLEMLEQELMTSHKKLDDMDLENENLQAEVKFLQERLAEQEASASVQLPEPSTPNAYYEDKLRELSQEADELRWKLIEKDREIERLSVVQTRHIREHSHHKKDDKLKKSKSLDTETDLMVSDLKKQLEYLQMEVIRLRKNLEETSDRNEELQQENEDLKNRTPVPSVQADDAALENIELRDKIRRLEEDGRCQADTVRLLTDSLQRLSRDTRTYTTIATSPTVPGTLSIPGIPLVGPGNQVARAALDVANQRSDPKTRDPAVHVLRGGNMAERGETGSSVTRSEEPGDPAARVSPELSTGEEKGDVGERKVPRLSSEELTLAWDTSTTFALLASRPKERDLLVTKPSETPTSEKQMEKAKADGKEKESEDDTGGGDTSEERDSDEAEEEEEEGGNEASASRGRLDSEDEPRPRSILLDYPEMKSKVTTTGEESRVELMEKVLDMDDEISELLTVIRQNEDENVRLRREVRSLKTQLREMKEESRRVELELLQELDMLHDKNSVMSNLLDIINERAEAAEEELERRDNEDTARSPARSASNVSQVSALSDTSMGSDEVFLNAHGNKEGVVTRDWEVRTCVLEYTEFRESKLKVRIESLERLLAEERQKVSMAEKKLLLAGINTIAPSVSDDVKLRMREKELLQEELLKSQRHLHIATDQIQGLKERIQILEEEHQRLKVDYGKLYDEIDKPLGDEGTEENLDPSLKSAVNSTSVSGAPKLKELQRLAVETNDATQKTESLEAELAKYKERARELEFKVEELNDILKSQSAASDKEKQELETQLKQRTKDVSLLEETIETLKLELCANLKMIAEQEVTLREKEHALAKQADVVKDNEGENKRRELDHQSLMNQISQRDGTIRNLHETLRIRDERLKEKDDILFKLNSCIEDHKNEMRHLGEKLHKASLLVSEKDAMISVLRGQISSSSVMSRDAPASCQTDAEKEGFRLKEALNSLQLELDTVAGEKKAADESLEKARRALDEAMFMWDRERNELQKEANILEEKVRMYECYNTMGKDETIETLKEEAQGYFNEKEALVCELSSIKLKAESADRIHKEQMAKLQAELTEKLRLLKMEVDNSSHMNTEMERLRRQAEMAYRLQQEHRVLKAEHLAIKVRYETRIDKMSKEQNKMLLTIEKLQKEHDLDKQIIQGIQKNLSLVKDKYTEELLRSDEDKVSLQRQLKEIEESRGHLEELQKHIRDLREKTIDQDRLRSELINKFAMDRSGWEIERANLNSHINQLEEQLSCTSRQQERSKDIQVNMGMAWEKERREQRRLLGEAHTLALDLQEQLRSREETSAHERKELIRQMESDRLTFAKMTKETEKRMTELESSVRTMATLQKRLKELQEKSERDNEFWQKEKTDLIRLLAQSRHSHARDVKAIEDVISGLIRLRELGMMLKLQPRGPMEEKPPDIEQNILDFVKEALNQICRAADDLINIANPTTDEGAIKRISSSEVDLLKHELCDLRHEGDDVFIVSDVSTTSITRTMKFEEEARGVSRLATDLESLRLSPPAGKPEVVSSVTGTSHAPFSKSEQSSAPAYIPQLSVPVVLRHGDHSRHDRPPSYTSGTRSAQTSRATTPETGELSPPVSFSTLPSRKSGLPEPPPSFVIPHKFPHPRAQPAKPLVSAMFSGQSSHKPKRPVTFMKSLSVDSAPLSPPIPRQPQPTSISASNTPTHPVTSAEMTSYFSTPSVISPTSDNLLSVSGSAVPRSSSFSASPRDRISPRTARRKFFEETSASGSAPIGYQSWPERRSVSPSLHSRQQSLPNADDVRRVAEEEHQHVITKLESLSQHPGIRTSTSFDEKMHYTNTTPVSAKPAESSSKTTTKVDAPTPNVDTKSNKHGAKEKRRFFKKEKACSLDSTVGSTIASVGVAAMPPAAPTGFTPSEIFAAVKGKLKPVFKRKSADSGSKPSEARSPSPLFIQTEVPEIHFASQGSLPVPAPHVDQLEPSDQDEVKEFVAELPSERSRDTQRAPHGKWRSKSADRIQHTSGVHADVIRPISGVWTFNETAV
ncbi:trichohyalin-like isoform X2 [Physella acuta]|uniref:trichohyalin-like isoform X2 n=1 Tax=Physella acuta TaxID=109671 RepID=UPI0027DB1B23|nr:trichohyalin-like isoform X2 [Physella acuta]